jgi:hypothetical protein
MVSDAPKGQPTQWLQDNPLPFAYWIQRRDQQMLFTSPQATPDGRITFSIKPQAKSDIVWLDNIIFEPIEAGNFDDATQRAKLFTNPTESSSTISLDAATYQDVNGQPVSGSLTLAPFTSQILVVASGTSQLATHPPIAPHFTVIQNSGVASGYWSSISDVQGYRLYYAPSSDTNNIMSMDMADKMDYSIALPSGSSYYAAVKAYNAFGESDYSNIESIAIP